MPDRRGARLPQRYLVICATCGQLGAYRERRVSAVGAGSSDPENDAIVHAKRHASRHSECDVRVERRIESIVGVTHVTADTIVGAV